MPLLVIWLISGFLGWALLCCREAYERTQLRDRTLLELCVVATFLVPGMGILGPIGVIATIATMTTAIND